MTQTIEPTTPEATIVPGSDGLLLEIDGRIVPNYDATITPFKEGDVVTGKVVRIDHDEVLVDIGYKSEGVIPSHELSIRKSVAPSDEVEIGEEVDALVLIKEENLDCTHKNFRSFLVHFLNLKLWRPYRGTACRPRHCERNWT